MSIPIDRSTRIYIAGHTGLLGSAFLRKFQNLGFTKILTQSHADLDLRSADRVSAFFSDWKPELVFLCAGRVGGILENRDHPAEFITENIAIQLNVIQAAFQYGTRWLFFFGSTCMYPRDCRQPMRESDLLMGPLEPTSLSYALAKLAGVQTCLAYNEQYGEKRFLPLIPNNVFGPKDNFNLASCHVLPALLRRFHEAKLAGHQSVSLWGTGNPKREFLFSDDIANACYFLMENGVDGLEFPINIGMGVDYSVRELAERVSTVVGYNGKFEFDGSNPDGAPRKMVDSSRIFSLGWRPTVGLEEGLRRTYDWYLKEGPK